MRKEDFWVEGRLYDSLVIQRSKGNFREKN